LRIALSRFSGATAGLPAWLTISPRVLVARGKIQDRELARAGLTTADAYTLLRQQGVGDLG